MAILRVIKGNNSGRIFELKTGTNVLGRETNACQIVLGSAAVSRKHASIEVNMDGTFIEDLFSRNKTVLNNQPLTPGPEGRVELRDRDWIEINGFCMVFEDDPSSDSSSVLFTDETEDAPFDIAATVDTSGDSSHFRQAESQVNLSAALDIVENLSGTMNLKDALSRIMESLLESFRQAQCGILLLRDSLDADFVPMAVKQVDSENQELRVSRSIVNHVVENRQAVLSTNASDDKRFAKSSSAKKLDIRSILCAPLIDRETDAVLGIIQLESFDPTKPFERDDLDVLASVSRHLSTVVGHAKLHDSRFREQRLLYEQRFQNLIEGSIQGILIHRDQKPLFVNKAYADFHGYTTDEVLNMKSMTELMAPEDRDRMLGYMETRKQGEDAPSRYQYRGLRKDGTTVWFENLVSVVDWGGRPAIQATIYDISERKRVEQELRASENLRRSITESSPDFVMLLDFDGQIEFINRTRPELTVEQVVGTSIFDYVPAKIHESIRKGLQNVRETGTIGHFETEYHGPEGVSIFETRVAPLMRDGEVAAFVAHASDFTERKRNERMVRGRNKVLEQLASGSSLEEVLTILVNTAEEIIPELRASVLFLDEDQNCLRHGAAPSLPDFYNEAIDGLEIGPSIGSCGAAAFTGERVIVADVMQHPNWAPYREIAQQVEIGACWSEPIISSKGKILGTFAMYYHKPQEPESWELDYIKTAAHLAAITIEHKRDEEQLRVLNETLEGRVQQRTAELARSNEDLQQFAYIVSHDLQEPLRSISGFCDLLKRRYQGKLDEKADEFLDFTIDASVQMQRLIRDLLEYSRVATRGGKMVTVDCREVFEQALAHLRIAIEESGAEITQTGLTEVVGDRTQFVQLFQNLLANAIKFRSERPLKIQVRSKDKRDYCQIEVEDNGIGIKPEHVDRAFVIFQQLHGRGEYDGTGVGLAICKKVVDRHGGRIWIESVPGEGTRFVFILPKARQQ